MSNFLNKLRPTVLERVKAIELQDENENCYQEINFLNIFHEKKPVIIAEIKFASPSRGSIYKGEMDPVAIARSYLENGASALSVLTEPHYFNGDIKYIREIRNAYPQCRILLKDFVLDRKQVLQGKEYGANAILLIAAFLEFNQLEDLYNFTLELGLTPLIEIHNIIELNLILPLKPKMVGINSRDLKTLEIDLATARELIPKIDKRIHTICESGIDNSQTMKEMLELGYDGFLIGSSFMQTVDPGIALSKILNEMK